MHDICEICDYNTEVYKIYVKKYSVPKELGSPGRLTDFRAGKNKRKYEFQVSYSGKQA